MKIIRQGVDPDTVPVRAALAALASAATIEATPLQRELNQVARAIEARIKGQPAAQTNCQLLNANRGDYSMTVPIQVAIAALKDIESLDNVFQMRLTAQKARIALQTAQPVQFVDLHAAIMNLPCVIPGPHGTKGERDSYKQGHHDARHAAAELVAAHEHDAQPVQSIDTAEFHALLFRYWETFGTRETNIEGLIAHIDAHIAQRAAAVTDSKGGQSIETVINELGIRAEVDAARYRNALRQIQYCCAVPAALTMRRIAAAALEAAPAPIADEVAVHSYRRKLADGSYSDWKDCSAEHVEHVQQPEFCEGFQVRTLYTRPPAPKASAPAGELPPLPDPSARKGTWYSISSPEDHFTADQMHAYVLADRTARAAPAPAPAPEWPFPAPEPVLFYYTNDPTIQYEYVGKARGAGTSSDSEIIVYRSHQTGEFFFRTPEDFEKRMIPV